MLKRLLPWTVRMATAADEDALYDALIALYADNSVADSYTPSSVRAQIRKGTSESAQWGGMIGVIDAPDGRIAATVGIFPNSFWYSTELALFELWLFVRPEYRRLALHATLFAFAKAYRDMMADELHRPVKLITSVSSDKRLPAKIRLWSFFARQVGALFVVED